MPRDNICFDCGGAYHDDEMCEEFLCLYCAEGIQSGSPLQGPTMPKPVSETSATKPNPPLDLDEVRTRHVRTNAFPLIGKSICDQCKKEWPCDAIQLVGELADLRITKAAVELEALHRGQQLASQGAEIVRLREALEKIRNAYPDAICLRIARAALKGEPE